VGRQQSLSPGACRSQHTWEALEIVTATLRWTLDSRSFLFVKNEDGVSNIRSQPISGGASKKITRFASDLIWGDLSRDAKMIVMDRGNQGGDVVLIRDVR
jgi:hypothetical protein